MRSGVRRSGLAVAGLALGVTWVAATGWLDRKSDTGRTLAVAAPVHGQKLRAGAKAHLDVRAEARGLTAGCVLTATDHVDTWRHPIGKSAGVRELKERLGPLHGHGERLAWFDLGVSGGTSHRPTARTSCRFESTARAEGRGLAVSCGHRERPELDLERDWTRD